MKITLAVILGVTVLGVIAAVVVLNITGKTKYTTLFTGLSQEEAQQIVGLLQDDGVEYTYNAKDGSIRVSEDNVEQERVKLLSQGYPKSGFTYSMYISNAGLMTTESDKEMYTLYDLQDRLGATIRLFDGVQDAKVTIAQGSDTTYALSSAEPMEASASAVVTMKTGETLSPKNADAIKNLIARSVRGINFTNVSVFNAETMEEVGGTGNADSASGASMADLTVQVENNIANNIRRVLGKLYGTENIAVSVKGTLDMAKLISENTVYHVPDQQETDPNRIGLLDHEQVAGEASGTTEENVAGVVGTDANADTPRYVNQNGTNLTNGGYYNNSHTRDWLYDVLKEQREISPGVLKDATVAVVINTSDRSIDNAQLINLVADAAGISRLDAGEKITIIRSGQSAEEAAAAAAAAKENETTTEEKKGLPTAALIAIAAGVILLLLIILLILRHRAKKKKAAQLAAEEEAARIAAEEEAARLAAEEEARKAEEERKRQEMLDHGAEDSTNQSMTHVRHLKDMIGDFVDNNPQVVAKLLQGWLRDDESDGKGKKRNGRK